MPNQHVGKIAASADRYDNIAASRSKRLRLENRSSRPTGAENTITITNHHIVVETDGSLTGNRRSGRIPNSSFSRDITTDKNRKITFDITGHTRATVADLSKSTKHRR